MKFLCWLALLLLPVVAHANSLEKLKEFIGSTNAAQANFSQIVIDQKGKKIRDASGVMMFQRPGKFRWVYQKPYEQIIVGDGAKFWLYDADLNQVTVKKLDAALGSSPAALLAGNNEIERSFSLKDQGPRESLNWLLATPKGKDGTFERILMGFDDKAGLSVMELFDSFGHRTVLRFSGLQRNPKFNGNPFQFKPPADADVLDDE